MRTRRVLDREWGVPHKCDTRVQGVASLCTVSHTTWKPAKKASIDTCTDIDRYGRKCKDTRFDGFKVVVSTDQSSEMILDIADVTASGSDGATELRAGSQARAKW